MKKYHYIIFILILTFLILGFEFFFKYGIYFLLDGTFSPVYDMKNFFEISFFWHLNNFLSIVFGYIIYSKFFLFSTVFFYGIYGVKLSNLIIGYLKIEEKYSNILNYIFVLFIYFNPFFYERIITQPGITLSYLFIGFGFYFLIKNIIIPNQSVKNFVYSGIFFGFAFNLMPHGLFIIFLIYLTYFLFYIRDKKNFLFLISSGIIFLGINFNWLIGNLFLNSGNTLNYVNSINQQNIDNFITNSLSNLGEEITTLFLYGFWGEKWNHLFLPTKINENWYISGGIILFIIFFGFIKLFNNKEYRKFSLFLFVLGIISYGLGVGIIAKWGYISQFLYDYLPLYNGMREPHKWIGILSIIYSIYFIIGIYFIYKIIEKNIKFKYLKISFLITIFLFLNGWNPNILFGFNGQLFINNYPKEYFFLRNNELKTNYKTKKYLILPWHSYLGCDYTYNKIVPNLMINILYPLKIITSDNIEIGNLYTNSNDFLSKDIELFLQNQNIILLRKHNISHIIMLESCGDFKKNKDILNGLKNKKLIKEEFIGKKITLYKIN